MAHSSPNNKKIRVRQSQICYLHTLHLGVLECLYNRTRTKEKPSKICKITFTICPLLKKNLKLNDRLESTTLDETIRRASKGPS